jgi:AAA15 family ATPase/GTPase
MRIKEFYTHNFKSLVDFHLRSFSPTTILYGENNVGKSNILEFLHLIFKRKKQYNEGEMTEKPINFYSGVLDELAYGFHNNNYKDEIKFMIALEMAANEKSVSNEELKKLSGKRIPKDSALQIEIEGVITSMQENKNWAKFEVTGMRLDVTLIYQNTGEVHYLPKHDPEKKDQGTLRKIFESFVEPFNDCVLFIQSNRDMLPSKFDTNLTENISQKEFKKFLYTLYLSEEKHHIFEKINEVFNNDPFNFGEISFAKINNELELMILKNNIRLPIKSLGSSVLQILYIITCIIYSGKNIICLEELEQNLSPNNQQETLEKLRSMLNLSIPPDQLIISSHSPFFYETKSSESTYFLKNVDGKTKIAARDGEKPKNEGDYDPSEVEYYKGHFPGLEDFY